RDRHTGFASSRTSSVLVAHRLHRTGGRPDELDIATFADLHEVRVLGEEPVSGVNRVNVADLGRAHDPIDSQITFQAGCRTDADRFVRELDMQRIDVCFRINCKGANAEFFTGANYPQRNLSPVSNQTFLEHGWQLEGKPFACQLTGPRQAKRLPYN